MEVSEEGEWNFDYLLFADTVIAITPILDSKTVNFHRRNYERLIKPISSLS